MCLLKFLSKNSTKINITLKSTDPLFHTKSKMNYVSTKLYLKKKKAL